ncbi:conserved hypothetical protein [Neospora caninum Liverpool]|uniref:RRM domain-containing protein n=1 Tax=Neospora caninum (strain Liverpool) TaxID=572307 RepID=F0VMU3_NEOCL|nr:conserved hypothetical protein [Neospora caninum Liverpool]CBZ55039.1 conserved hypothetical protein [Neospora caninum Liverpool]CEL69763.1 TPA: hypothetical protein BN1204_054640 [Neospora caninum Liverpool]|eukprot:XP_003885067.1 conserved hypothetical protein [Neospora caninum Liverpool]
MLGRRRKGVECSVQPRETKRWRLELNEASSAAQDASEAPSNSARDPRTGGSPAAAEEGQSSPYPRGARLPEDGEEETIVPNLTEEELRLLQADEEEGEARDQRDRERGATDGTENGSDGAEKPEDGAGEKKPKKRRRFAWMESDDESITASSSEEEEAEQDPQEATTSAVAHASLSPENPSPAPSPPSPGTSSASATDSSSSSSSSGKAGDQLEEDVVSASVFASDLAALGLRFAGAEREELCERMQRCITCLFLANLSFEAPLGEIETWVHTHTQVAPMQVFAAPSNDSAYKAPPPAGSGMPANGAHRGRVFVELGSYAKVRQAVQKLNGLYLRGRPVRALFAFCVDGRPCTLQTAMHLKYLRQHVLQDLLGVERGSRFHRHTPAWKIDGGCNWGGT